MEQNPMTQLTGSLEKAIAGEVAILVKEQIDLDSLQKYAINTVRILELGVEKWGNRERSAFESVIDGIFIKDMISFANEYLNTPEQIEARKQLAKEIINKAQEIAREKAINLLSDAMACHLVVPNFMPTGAAALTIHQVFEQLKRW